MQLGESVGLGALGAKEYNTASFYFLLLFLLFFFFELLCRSLRKMRTDLK